MAVLVTEEDMQPSPLLRPMIILDRSSVFWPKGPSLLCDGFLSGVAPLLSLADDSGNKAHYGAGVDLQLVHILCVPDVMSVVSVGRGGSSCC